MDLTALLALYRTYHPQLAETTAEQYGYAIRSVEKVLGRTPTTDDLEEQTVLRFIAARLATVSPRTCKRERGDIFTLWRFAWRKKLCAADPRDADVPAVKQHTEPPVALTVQQVEAILDSCRFERGCLRGTNIPKAQFWRHLVLTCYWTGARIGAILTCHQTDLDRTTGWLRLRAETAKTRVGQFVQVPLDLAAELPYTEMLFPWPCGRRQLFVALKRIVVRAGLPPSREYRFHCFRRTAATLITANSSLETASRALGHATPTMTRRYVDPRQAAPSPQRFMPRVVG